VARVSILEGAQSDMTRPDLNRELDRWQHRLPPRFAGALRWIRRPSSAWARWPIAILLVLGGFLSFLPVLGLWMLPLGLVLIAQDIPILQPPLARLLAWADAKWPAKQKAPDTGG